MIALDTNVLVRLFVRDDEAQADRAKDLVDAFGLQNGSLFISDVVLAELCWTLARAYERNRSDIVRVIRALLGNATIRLESPEAVRSALAVYERGPADFADCLIVAKAKSAGCVEIVTFDRRMQTLPSVRLL
jgi:predicted nucleic-acid-binding protein